MNGFKEKIIREIIRLGKKNHSLRMPALALAALFLVAYHSVRSFFLEFRYHPIRQRILVGILVLSLLAGQIEITNVFAESAAGNTETVEDTGDRGAGNAGSRTISVFSELPDDVREQTVPVGTALEELTLPGTLEAYVTVEAENNAEDDKKPDNGDRNKDDNEDSDDSGQDKGDQENPDDSGQDKGDQENPDEGDGGNGDGGENPDDGNEVGGDNNADENGDDKENPGDSDENGADGEENTGDGDGNGADGEENLGGGNGYGAEATENPADGNISDDNGAADDSDNAGSENIGTENSGITDSEEKSAEKNDTDTQSIDTDVSADTDSAANTKSSGFGIQTGSFVMPVYMSENPQDDLTVETLENTPSEESGSALNADTEGTADHTERTAETKAVTIEDITWKSSPAYDGDAEGVYLFTPILPEDCALADGVSLPEITVTVVADDTQAEELRALMELLRALPDPEEYLTYDEAEDLITEHEDMIDEAQLEEAREAADDYLDKYPGADTDSTPADDTDSDAGTDSMTTDAVHPASLTALLIRLEGLEHIRGTVADCMDLDCPYHYPWFVQQRMAQNEVPELLTLEDLIEDYGVEAPQAPAAQTYSSRARAAGTYAAAAYAAPTLHPQTLMVTTDNENNAHTGKADGDIDKIIASRDLFGKGDAAHPIELSFTLNELPTQSAYLAVKAYDVDEEYGEVDCVYLNDDIYTLANDVGNLSGTDSTWNTTVLEIPIDRLQKGKNVISVTVAANWVVKVDWMQLVLDGGAVDSNIEEFSLKIKDTAMKGGNVTVYSDVTVKQKGSIKYVTEYTLTEISTGNALDACFGSASSTETVGLTMPLSSTTGVYKITGILKNPGTEEIKAIDSTTFYFIKDVGIGPNVSHTLTPDTLTNQNVLIQVSAESVEGVTNVAVSSASRTVTANGTYNFTVSYKVGSGAQSFTYPVKVDNIDKTAPVITYTPISVEEDTALAEVKEMFDKALLATDNRKLAEEPFTYTLPTNISNSPGTKNVTVTAADLAGNKATKVCQITVTAKPISLTMGELKAVTGSKDSYALKAVLDHTGADPITETGFVWGVMPSPTLDLKNGTVKTSTVVKTKGGTLSASATGLSSGVEYYARAYAKVTDAAGKASVVYSDAKKFGFGIPAYGTFSVSGVSGTTFTITRTGGTDKSQTVYYRTVNGSAIGGTHFTHAAGTVIFADGEKTKTVTVTVTESGVTTAYGGKPATSYSNADRTYSFEIYRVDGGGSIDQSKRSKTCTMKKNGTYTVNRTVYTENDRKVNTDNDNNYVVDRSDTKDHQTYFRNNRGYNLTHGQNNFNVQRTVDVGNEKENTYLKNTAEGYYYRLRFTAKEVADGWEHIWIADHKPNNFDSSNEHKGPINIDDNLFGPAKYTARFEIKDGETADVALTGTRSNVPSFSPSIRSGAMDGDYLLFGINDEVNVWFSAAGSGQDKWQVLTYKDWIKVRDTKEPQLLGVAPMAGGAYLPGDPITVSLVFDEIVDKTNSGDLSKVTISTNVGTLTYAGGADTNVLYFTGTVSSTASLSGSSALKVTGITNNSSIKDMCDQAGTTSSFTSSNTNVDVDATKPTVTITAKTSGTLPRHQASVTATGAASVQYAWTKDTNLPAYGWQTTTSGATLTESRGTAGATETWYLHVLATASSGASTHAYQSFSFRQPAITAVSVRAGSTASTADVADVWKTYKYIVVQYAGTQTSGTTLTIDGPQTSSQNITATSGTKYLYVTKNGTYTITLKDGYGNVASQTIEVKKIDTVKPTVTLRSGSSTGTDATYNALSVSVLPEDTGGSGVAKVEYAWTGSTSAPSTTSEWITLSPAADGSYQAEYTATETTKTAKYLHVRVTDGAGNVSTVARSGPYQMLKKATTAELPTITVTGIPTTWKKSATLTWTVKAGTGTGAGTIQGVYTPDSNTPKTGTTGTCTVTKNGIYMFTVTDSNGNSVTTEVVVTKLDNEAPELTNLTATGGKIGTITLTGVTDNCTVVLDAKGNYSSIGGSGVNTTRQYQMAGESSWKPFTGNSLTVDKNGTYTVRLTDNVGNYSDYSVDMTDIDATAPKVTCTVNATPNAASVWYTVSPVPIVLTFADEAGQEGGTPSGIQSVQYKIVTDNSAAPTGVLSSLSTSTISSGTYTYSMSSNGKYYLYYIVKDNKGNVKDGFSDLIQKDSYTGSSTTTGSATGQPISKGLAMNIMFTYGPSGGYLTCGPTAASTERIATMEQHAEGTKVVNAPYTAKTSGANTLRYYRYAENGATGTTVTYSYSFYVRQITFNSQGGSAVESQLVWDKNNTTAYCTAVKPTDPTRTGYTFGGWYTDAACTVGKEFDFTKQIRANTTLYAKWTANTYNVTYHLINSDGSVYAPAETVKTYTYGQGLTLPKPSQTGFAFCGWYENANYTGTAYTSIAKTATGDKEYYAYFKDTQAPVITFDSYVGVASSGGSDNWLRAQDANTPQIRVSCTDNKGVQTVSVKVDNGSFSTVGVSSNGANYQYDLQEGEHTYTFKAADAAGNETVSNTWTVKLDRTKPEIGEITCEKKVTGFLNWIIGKESLIVHIPVTDSHSGVTGLTYTETTITVAGDTTQTKTVSLSGKPGQQTVDLKLDADWKGRISNITCTDKAGNVSDSKTVGGENGGVIVEDNPPTITITEADMSDAANPKPGSAVSTDYYAENTAPTLYVSVKDDGADSNGISAGIRSITYSVGGGAEQTVSGNFATGLSGDYAFTIPMTGYAGVVNVTVKAADNAGNTAQAGINVKIRGTEAEPNAKTAYLKDALANLTPGAAYEITVPTGDGGTKYPCTADENGEIPLILPITGGTIDLCGETIEIVKKGDVTNTSDSAPQTLAIVPRPPAPKGTVTPELAEGMDDAVVNITVEDSGEQSGGKKEYSTDDGVTWTDVPDDDNIIKDLAPGDVLIRMKATEAAPYGLSGTVTVDPSSYKIKVEFALNYADADTSSAPPPQGGLTGKSKLNKPTKPARDGFDFTGWFKSAACGEQEKWRFETTEDGEANVVGDIIDRTQDNYKDRYTVVDSVITVTLYAGWRENIAPTVNATLTNGTDSTAKDQNAWHPAPLAVTLTYSDNVGVTKLYAKMDEMDDEAYEELEISGSTQSGTDGNSTGDGGNDTDGNSTGSGGNVQYRYVYNDLQEGEHTYTFKAVDAAGNETVTSLTAKLDLTKPVLGEAAFNEGYKNLWDWIIRKDSLIITIHVTEAGSGLDAVEYTLTPVDGQGGNAGNGAGGSSADGNAGGSGADGNSTGGNGADGSGDITTGIATVKKVSGSNGSYTATITIDPDFKGTITVVAKDIAGNNSDTKTIGADGSGITGVIVEDNAPDITILADRSTADDASTQSGGTALSEDYYNSAPKLFVKVEDDVTGSSVITSGLEAVSWRIDDSAEHTESVDFESDVKSSHSFTIGELENRTGILQVTVKAVDQAGNTAQKTVTVRVKARAEKPTPDIDYFNEKLTGLVSGGKYGIGEETVTADAQGCIAIREEWFGTERQIHRKGEENTLDSENSDLSIAARPAAPDVSVSKDETIRGKKDVVLAGTDTTMEYSVDGGSTWTAVEDSDITDGCMTDRAAGRILFRIKATNSAPRGEQAEVTVEAGRTLTVTFEENGGSSVSDLTGKMWHDTVAEPETPMRAGYALVGWYQDEACTNIWHFASAGAGADLLTDDLTLYAKWKDSAGPAINAVLKDGNGEKDGENWYQNLFVTLTYSDNVDVTKLYAKVDGGAYTELTSADSGSGGNTGENGIAGSTKNGKDAAGYAQYQYIYNDLQEGEHTYIFKAVDAAGNETETNTLTAKLDLTKPTLGEVSFNEGHKNLWNWIIRKKSLIITIPVSEAGSGIDAVEYILTPADELSGSIGENAGSSADGNRDITTGNAVVKKASDSSDDYTATITIASDFKGTITIVARDNVGNFSDTKTIGTDGGGINGVIVEDNAPKISFSVDEGVLSESYYDEAPQLTVHVFDDTDEYDETVITGGIADLTYQVGDGSVKTVDHDYTSNIVTSDSFTIPAAEIPGGVTRITVTATDHAGNQAVQSITVRVKAVEATPNAGIGYRAEILTGLVANAVYLIDDVGMTADADGTIAIEEEWMPATLSIVKLGDDSTTFNSASQDRTVPARPSAPVVSGQNETYPGAGDGVLTGLSAGTAYEISDDGSTWKDASLNGTEVRGLEAGTYQVRVKAVEGVNFKSRAAEATVGTTPATPYETPNAQINYREETLTGLVPDAEYVVEYSDGTGEDEENEEENGADAMIFKTDADGNITIDEKWFDMTLSIVRKGNGKEKSDSEAQSLPIPARPQTPSPAGADETGPDRKDGKLTGLTAGTPYEISKDGGKTWISRTADADGEIKDVDAPADYVVRVSATDSSFASLPSDPVTVDSYKITVTFMANGEIYKTVPVYYGGDLEEIPSVPPKKDAGDRIYVGVWCSDEQGTSADFTNITADMTVYAVYTATYTVTLQDGTGYTLSVLSDSVNPVKEGGSFSFGFELGEGYHKTKNFAVKVNGTAVKLTEEENYTITDIREDKTVTVSGVVKNSAEKPGGTGDKDKEPDDTPPTDSNPPVDNTPPTDSNPPVDNTPPTDSNPPVDNTPPTDSNPPVDNTPPTDSNPPADNTPPTGSIPDEAGDPPIGEAVQTVPSSIEDGRIVISGETVETGNITQNSETTTRLEVGDGAVVVTVVCEDEGYTAGVKDTVAVANAVLMPEQIQRVNGGETIEIRIDVKDISETVTEQEKGVIESGLTEYKKEIPELTLGMYVDISMFIRIGEGGWDAVTSTKEPIEVIIGIPEELQEDGREFYIIRSHEGEYTLLSDMDDAPDTITISTDMFSAYAIAFKQTDTDHAQGGNTKCGLCNICPTFLGICYFIWLAVIIAAILVIVLIVRRRKKEDDKEQTVEK